MEGLEVLGRALASDHDAGLVGLADVAAPQLVHAGEDVVLGTTRAVGRRERDHERVLRLTRREPALGDLRPPAQRLELLDHAGAGAGSLESGPGRRGGVRPSSAMPSLTWAALQRRVTTGGPIRTPNAPWPRRWSAIGASQAAEVVGVPVDDRALGQVGEVALQPRELAVEHQAGADERLAVEPAERLRRATRTSPRPRPGSAGSSPTTARAGTRGGRRRGSAGRSGSRRRGYRGRSGAEERPERDAGRGDVHHVEVGCIRMRDGVLLSQ